MSSVRDLLTPSDESKFFLKNSDTHIYTELFWVLCLLLFLALGVVCGTPGDVAAQNKAAITEWTLPSSNSEPLNVLPTSEKSVFVAERAGSRIGRLNTETNEFVEWPLALGSNPHGLLSANGKLIFAEEGFATGAIGALNPGTNELTEWPVSTVSYPFPQHVVSGKGGYYFTEAYGNRIGRINPQTNQLREWPLPPQTWFNLNGMDISDDGGDIWIVEILARKVARLRVQTNTLTEWDVGHNGLLSHVKFSQGFVYFVDTAGSIISRLNPATNTLTEWTIPTPNAAIEDLEINFNEGSGRPNPNRPVEIYFDESGGNRVGKLVTNKLQGIDIAVAPVSRSLTPLDSVVTPSKLTLQRLTSRLFPVSSRVDGISNGGVTEWNVPTPSSGLGGVALSGKSRLFFVEREANKVGVIGQKSGCDRAPARARAARRLERRMNHFGK